MITSVLYCSVIPPVDPVPTVTAYEDVRHGETVHSEAGVSDSVETRCRDTGIQLAANQLNVPGNLVQIIVAFPSSCSCVIVNSITIGLPPLEKVAQLASHMMFEKQSL